MKVQPTSLPEVLLLQPRVFADARGFFLESYNQRSFAQATGCQAQFVQDNHSRSVRGVLRGLHYQLVQPQGKLVRVVRGAAFDVAVDLRRHSPRFGQWTSVELSEHNQHQLWIPAGFAHGFLALAETTEVIYKTTDFYAPAHERSLAWNDPAVAIAWPLAGLGQPVLSEKDAAAPGLDRAEVFESPDSQPA